MGCKTNANQRRSQLCNQNENLRMQMKISLKKPNTKNMNPIRLVNLLHPKEIVLQNRILSLDARVDRVFWQDQGVFSYHDLAVSTFRSDQITQARMLRATPFQL